MLCLAVISIVLQLTIRDWYQHFLTNLFSVLGQERAIILAHEIPRKSYHLIGSAILIAIQFFSSKQIKLIGVIFLAYSLILICSEQIRLNNKDINRYFIKFAKDFMRPLERTQMTSQWCIFVGVGIVLFFFNKTIAEYALCTLFYGDFAAAIFGISLGHHKVGQKRIAKSRKTIEGFLGCALVCTYFCYHCGQYSMQKSIIVGCLSSFFELVSGWLIMVDDNLILPIGSALIYKYLKLLK